MVWTLGWSCRQEQQEQENQRAPDDGRRGKQSSKATTASFRFSGQFSPAVLLIVLILNEINSY
jgi:hypothetical protein